MVRDEKTIYVFADFLSCQNELIGRLFSSGGKGKDVYSFEYEPDWLAKSFFFLDPDLRLYRGRQYLDDDKNIFGMFADSCPDRWGRLLMNRREVLRARGADEKPRKLQERDYLLGVYDEARIGGLRFKTDLEGEYLSDDKEYAIPPWTSLRKLEQASAAFEKDESGLEEKWLKQLIAPGSSLGGARPKASIQAVDGSLWIAKFPSRHDDNNTGAWEMTVHDLALLCGLDVPEAKLEKFSSMGSTYLVKRFDRDGKRRVHFSSAMTMLGKKDGADAADGSSYLEIVSFLKACGASPAKDMLELWKRIVFSMAVSNTDDHFRNHGFILTSEGWRLSPLYDVNPDIYGNELSLNVNGEEAELDFELAIEAAPQYGLGKDEAYEIVQEIKQVVSDHWKEIALGYGISRGEIRKMEPAFRNVMQRPV